jgi:subtilisin family serine protease
VDSKHHALKTIPANVLSIATWIEIRKVYFNGIVNIEEPDEIDTTETEENYKAQPGLNAINANKLWDLGITGKGRLVMNIDSGVDDESDSLMSRWWGNVAGVLPTWAWFDATENYPDYPHDGNGHGTHTMGIMCGVYKRNNNPVDTFGVAPDAKWIAAKITGTITSMALASFQWAANPDSNVSTMEDVPDVINCSFFDDNISLNEECNGASGYWSVIDAVEALGTAVVWSAGNNGRNGSATITPPKNRNTTGVNFSLLAQ